MLQFKGALLFNWNRLEVNSNINLATIENDEHENMIFQEMGKHRELLVFWDKKQIKFGPKSNIPKNTLI